jgi:hypothetical protein
MKHQDIIDETIERALVRDSKDLPPFPTTPNSALTAKLAISIASKGMLGTLGAKLTLFGGIAVVAGAALYFTSSNNNSTPSSTPAPQPPTPVTQVVPIDTTKRDTIKPPQAAVSTTRLNAAMKTRSVHLEQAKSNPAPTVAKDSTPVRRIENPNYQPPLK